MGWERVLVKVNFITTKAWDTGATTDPIVVEALIKRLKELPVEVAVVESDATMTNATKAFKVTGMAEMCERNGDGSDCRYEGSQWSGSGTPKHSRMSLACSRLTLMLARSPEWWRNARSYMARASSRLSSNSNASAHVTSSQ